jgi:hypothetical protein
MSAVRLASVMATWQAFSYKNNSQSMLVLPVLAEAFWGALLRTQHGSMQPDIDALDHLPDSVIKLYFPSLTPACLWRQCLQTNDCRVMYKGSFVCKQKAKPHAHCNSHCKIFISSIKPRQRCWGRLCRRTRPSAWPSACEDDNPLFFTRRCYTTSKIHWKFFHRMLPIVRHCQLLALENCGPGI